MNRRSNIFLLLFCLSGACALIYEVVWTRLFTPVVGNTAFSVSAILAVFMAGLALGSRLLGRLIDRRVLPLIRTYALLEAGVGIYNLILPSLLRLADPVFGFLYASSYDSFAWLSLVRLLLSVSLLIVPATLMGGTLPILIRYYTGNVAAIGLHAGRVYTANNCGAAVGTMAAGFLLIPLAGVRLTLTFAAILNLALAGVAWMLSRYFDAPSVGNPENASRAGPRIVLVAMFISGCAALINEVAWTRVLALIVGPTTYAFTLMLTSMIAGLGVGAWLGSRWTVSRQTTLTTLAWIVAGVGFTSMALIPLFGRLPLWIGRLVSRYVESFAAIQGTEFLILFSIMLVPTTLLGLTFPVACKLYATSDSMIGTEVAAVYAFNTLGGILGSLAAGFLLIPWIGSQNVLTAAASTSVLLGAVLAASPARPPGSFRKLAAALVSLSLIPAVANIPRWDPELMTSGAYKYAPYYSSRIDLETALKRGELLYFSEGITATVSVKRTPDGMMLAIGGKIDATDSGDMVTQGLLAHLPLLLADHPRKVAIIGLGSGVTAAAALQHPIERLDIVEISPAVVEASQFFNHVNHEALKDPRVRLIIGDGRNHLRYTPTTYDVSISEPSNPWMSGMASLFTREFFFEARSRLSDEGIHCQWLHSYNMSTEDLRSIIRTFREAFPHAMLWGLSENDFLLLGSPAPIEIGDNVARNFERVRSHLAEIQIQDLYSILSLYLLRDEDLDRFAGGAVSNTDDLPVLEFRAPRFLYANTADQNIEAIRSIKQLVPPPEYVGRSTSNATSDNHRHKGEMYVSAGSFELAAREFQFALEKNVHDEEAWKGLIRADRGRSTSAVTDFIGRMLDLHREPVVRLAAADHYLVHSEYAKAGEVLRNVLETNPVHVAAIEKLCEVFAEEGNPELPAMAERLLALEPDNARALFHLAKVRYHQGRFDEGIELVKRSIKADPMNILSRNLLAVLYSGTLQYDRAEAEFLQTLKDHPNDSISYNNYGLFLLARGRYREARNQFEHSIDIDPEDVQGFVGIAETLRQSGSPKLAEEWYRKALKLAPDHPQARIYAK